MTNLVKGGKNTKSSIQVLSFINNIRYRIWKKRNLLVSHYMYKGGTTLWWLENSKSKLVSAPSAQRRLEKGGGEVYVIL